MTSKKAPPTIFWDFDGTLAHRPGMWSSAVMEALDEHRSGHGIELDDIRPFLRDQFPWHRPHEPHPWLSAPDAWWASIEGMLKRAIQGLGFPSEEAMRLARSARFRYLDASRFQLFEDTRPVLEMLATEDWRHIVLSNHVPELADIVEGVGLRDLIELVITSAATGFEKPHPKAFSLALGMAGNPEQVWMVGDNPDADVLGAEAAGIPGILVRREDPRVTRQAPDLYGVADLIGLDQ